MTTSALADETVVDRSQFSTTVEAGDAFKTRTYPEPINFEKDNGEWAAIDRALVSEPDGSVHPAAVDGDAEIPSSLSKPVVLEHDGQTVSFRLLGADQEADREVAGTKASFDDALGGVDVSYKVRHNGLKETITLASRASRRSFSYDVRTNSALTAKIVGGDLVFSDASGAEQFRVAAPLAWDSASLPETANALTLSVAPTGDRQWRLMMRADDKWLDDPARVYPVTLDPDYFWIDGYMRFHGASQDCALAGGSLAGQSRCAYPTLQIGYGNNRPYKSVMKFDIAAAIPAYATATASRFLAWQFPNSTVKADVSSRLRTVTRGWDDTATWDVAKTGTAWTTKGGDTSTDPNLTGPAITVGPSGYWSYWPAPLAAVNGWIKGTLPNHGFQISTETTYPNVINAYEFTSTDGAQQSWPALEVTWVPDTVAPDLVTDLRVSAYDGSGAATVAWDSPTDPVLSDGTPGSGIASVELIATVAGVQRSPVVVTNVSNYDLPNVSVGNSVQIDLRVTDRAGNQRTTSASTTLAVLLEDPSVDAAAADAYQEAYPGVTRAASEAWIRSQNVINGSGAEDITTRLRTAATVNGFGGVYFDNTARQFAVRLTSSANQSAVNAVVATLPPNTRVESAPHSAEHLGNVQVAIEDSLQDLMDANKVLMSGVEATTSINFEISNAATPAEKARIRAVNGQGIQLNFTEVDPAGMLSTPGACKFPDCDPPLRGGIKMTSRNSMGTLEYDNQGRVTNYFCSLGFAAKVNGGGGARVGVTAGHCVKDSPHPNWWGKSVDSAAGDYKIGVEGRYNYGGYSGDWGLITLESPLLATANIFNTKSKVAGPANTQRNENYKIRRAAGNVEGAVVCVSGGVTGSRCGFVDSRRANERVKDSAIDLTPTTVKGIARVKLCTTHGDSGGAVWKAGVAYGIIGGFREQLVGTNCKWTWYTGAVTVESKAGVTFGT